MSIYESMLKNKNGLYIKKIIFFCKISTTHCLKDCDRVLSVIYDNIMYHYRIYKISVN